MNCSVMSSSLRSGRVSVGPPPRPPPPPPPALPPPLPPPLPSSLSMVASMLDSILTLSPSSGSTATSSESRSRSSTSDRGAAFCSPPSLAARNNPSAPFTYLSTSSSGATMDPTGCTNLDDMSLKTPNLSSPSRNFTRSETSACLLRFHSSRSSLSLFHSSYVSATTSIVTPSPFMEPNTRSNRPSLSQTVRSRYLTATMRCSGTANANISSEPRIESFRASKGVSTIRSSIRS
mmetsp:Transcript_1089/g.2294  ORF Transcript_1089/g.2294 Transcript_1089/m.2294 type:complete len:234 (+) Transcript_1089:594-1295(+)